MTSSEDDKKVYQLTALAFFLIGFVATSVGIYLLASLGAALTIGGLFLVTAALAKPGGWK